MKILILAKAADDPATRYRVAPLVATLQARDDAVQVSYEPGFAEQLLILGRAPAYDLVFIQRKLFSPWFVRLLGLFARQLVFDFDDAIFLRSNGSASVTRSRRFNATIGSASLVLAGNEYLASVTREVSVPRLPQVSVIPTAVPVERYKFNEPKLPEFTLVWIGSHSTSRYLESHRSIFEAIGRAHPEIVLRVIGDFEFELEHLSVENVAWSAATEVQAIGVCHVGIAPMTDDRWTRGKCALKVIQYMAAGLPVISANVGANAQVVVQGETGYLTDTQSQWLGAVGELKASSELRGRMGQAGRQRAITHYSTAAVNARLVGLLDELTA